MPLAGTVTNLMGEIRAGSREKGGRMMKVLGLRDVTANCPHGCDSSRLIKAPIEAYSAEHLSHAAVVIIRRKQLPSWNMEPNGLALGRRLARHQK